MVCDKLTRLKGFQMPGEIQHSSRSSHDAFQRKLVQNPKGVLEASRRGSQVDIMALSNAWTSPPGNISPEEGVNVFLTHSQEPRQPVTENGLLRTANLAFASLPGLSKLDSVAAAPRVRPRRLPRPHRAPADVRAQVAPHVPCAGAVADARDEALVERVRRGADRFTLVEREALLVVLALGTRLFWGSDQDSEGLPPAFEARRATWRGR